MITTTMYMDYKTCCRNTHVVEKLLTFYATNPDSFSLPTNSSTDSTVWPASLTGGSSTLTTCWEDLISTPKSEGFLAVRGFFLAFYQI